MTRATTMARDYGSYCQHRRWLIGRPGHNIPRPMSGLGALEKNAVAGGELSAATEELIALAIAGAVRSNGCIAHRLHYAVEAEASRAEIAGTIGFADLMGGGSALTYGAEAPEELEQSESAARGLHDPEEVDQWQSQNGPRSAPSPL